jgi:predicted transcriptional regulator
MIPQAKILRVVELTKFLCHWRSVPEIANKLNISERTAYRYLKLLHTCGFVIGKDEPLSNQTGVYFRVEHCPFCNVTTTRAKSRRIDKQLATLYSQRHGIIQAELGNPKYLLRYKSERKRKNKLKELNRKINALLLTKRENETH